MKWSRLAVAALGGAVAIALVALFWQTRENAAADSATPNVNGENASESAQTGEIAPNGGKGRQPTQRGKRPTLERTSSSASFRRPARPPSLIKGAATVLAPPPDLDTSALRRPPTEVLKDQEIPKQYIRGVNLAYESYRNRDFETARSLGAKILTELPKNVSLRRLVVASSCKLGDKETARSELTSLPAFDSGEMREVCGDLDE